MIEKIMSMKLWIPFILSAMAGSVQAQYTYEATPAQPYGAYNPAAPEQLRNFEQMLGSCECESIRRKPDGTWMEKENMIWRWKYIMNGMAVQDESLKGDGSHSGSIRQYNADSAKWYVHWYSANSAPQTLPSWEGTSSDSTIQLYREQTAPNGMEGFYRLTFYNMRDEGYDWVGEWVNDDASIVYPTWKIRCRRE